jgi:signal transduction histidine kinase
LFSNPDHPFRRLRTQLIASFVISFLAIALGLGIPVVLTINRQAASQNQLLLDQALLSTRASLSGKESELRNLALLVSQRPSLARLLEQNDQVGLQAYMEVLRKGADLDLLLLCADGVQLSPEPTAGGTTGYCASGDQTGYAPLPDGNDLYLYSSAVLDLPAGSQYTIITGEKLSTIMSGLQAETGLLYFLFDGGKVLSSSDAQLDVASSQARELGRKILSTQSAARDGQQVKYLDHQYLLGSLPLGGHLESRLVSALNLDAQLAVQRNLNWTMILGLLLVVLIASVLGIFLSQRISLPMARLAHAAFGFRQGNLDTPVSLHSSIWEVRQLANTLEDARVALQHSLSQLQARTAWNEHLLNSIVEGILTLDNHNRVTFASDGVSNIIDAPAAGILGKGVDEVFLPVEGELSFSSQLPEVGKQRKINVEFKGGVRKLLSISKANFVPPEAENANRALVIRDVSHDEYVHRLLGDFMANITHEFRTPLAALEASVELLLDNLPSLSKPEIKELLLSLNLGIIDLQTLIDNLIESASIEAGRFKVSVHPVAFDAILKDALDIIRPLAGKYGMRLKQPEPPPADRVLADHRRTVQVLVNLLSNAIKHSPPAGCIRIDSTLSSGKLLVEVSDEGSGFGQDQRQNIFRRFSHLDGSDERARHGAGLGLSVVKAIVEAQQGEVGLKDTSQGGACIWFSIPLAEGDQA